jgi:hypothetical protein
MEGGGVKLIDCRGYPRQHAPAHATYIGRGTRGNLRSPLANPYVPESAGPNFHAVAVPDHKVLEYCRRHLTRNVVQGFPELRALKQLTLGSTLACWCADREAGLVGGGRPEAAIPCHGDVVFTVWCALRRRLWRVEVFDFIADPIGANKAWRELYEDAFGEPMRWGTREDCN